jgi:hypothetical protein
MGYISERVTRDVFESARHLIIAGHFTSEYQLYKVALLQAASTRSILTPGTLNRLPPSKEPKEYYARTYLPKEQYESVSHELKENIGSALGAWVRLVDQGVPAPGTTAFMVNHLHRRPSPRVY